jgi:ACS family tartrate transporter-like MFS transporter
MGQSGQTDPVLASALRKASWRLLPLIALGYGIAYIDRANISYAQLPLQHQFGLSYSVYGRIAGIFFLSYAACEIPSNLLLYRIGARRWLSRIMISWGVVSVATIFARTAHEFYAVRFLLGVAEAGFFPGIIYYIFLWFPDAVRARAITRFYIAFPISTIVMGSLAGTLMGLDGRLGLHGWQWLFLVEALPAVVLGAMFLFLLPDGPQDAAWLTGPERAAILTAVGGESSSRSSHASASIAPALRDIRVWLIGIFFCCVQTAGYGYSFFAPAMVQRITGDNVGRAGLLLALFGILGTISMLAAGWFSDYTGNRHSHVLPWCLVMIAGFIGCGFSSAAPIALPALALVFCGYTAMQGPLWAIPPAYLSGRSMAAGVAIINMLGILGGYIGPHWMGFARDLTGDYQRGLLTLAVPLAIAGFILLRLRALDRRDASAPPPLTL